MITRHPLHSPTICSPYSRVRTISLYSSRVWAASTPPWLQANVSRQWLLHDNCATSHRTQGEKNSLAGSASQSVCGILVPQSRTAFCPCPLFCQLPPKRVPSLPSLPYPSPSIPLSLPKSHTRVATMWWRMLCVASTLSSCQACPWCALLLHLFEKRRVFSRS